MKIFKKILNRRVIKTGRVFGVLFFLFFVLAKRVDAQKIYLNPSTGSFAVGENFTVEVRLDTEGQEVVAADAKISFDSSQLEIVEVNKGGFFDEVAHYVGTNSVLVGGFFNDPYKKKSGTGILATIIFKGKTAATTSLVFNCVAGKSDDSNIFSASGVDIIKCGSLGNGDYTLQGQGPQPILIIPTATPTVSNPNFLTPTPTLTPPTSGVVEMTVIPALSGILMLFLGGSFLFR